MRICMGEPSIPAVRSRSPVVAPDSATPLFTPQPYPAIPGPAPVRAQRRTLVNIPESRRRTRVRIGHLFITMCKCIARILATEPAHSFALFLRSYQGEGAPLVPASGLSFLLREPMLASNATFSVLYTKLSSCDSFQ